MLLDATLDHRIVIYMSPRKTTPNLISLRKELASSELAMGRNAERPMPGEPRTRALQAQW